jgi:Hint module
MIHSRLVRHKRLHVGRILTTVLKRSNRSYQDLTTGNELEYQAIVTKYRDITNYAPKGPHQDYLSASGVTTDYAYGELGSASLAIEIGTAFYQDCDYFETSILPTQLKALTYLAKISKAPFRLAKGPDVMDVSTKIQGNKLIVTAKTTNSTLTSQPNLGEIRVFINTHPYDVADNATGYLLKNGVVGIDVSFLPKLVQHTVYLQAMDAGGNKGTVTAAYFVRPANTVTTCFSGGMTVQVQNEGRKIMSDLKVGDRIKTSATADIFEPVYSFGHWNPVAEGEFLQIKTTSTMLELSSTHMLFVGGRPIPASMVRSGDRLHDGSVVETISTVNRRGVFAPFTPSGTIVVNGIMTSCYVAFQNSPVVEVGSFPTPLTYQWLAHSFEFPHRLHCYYFSRCHAENYDADGISLWMAQPNRLAHWLFRQSAVALVIILAPAVVILTLFTVFEMVLTSTYMMLGMFAVWWIYSRISASKQR